MVDKKQRASKRAEDARKEFKKATGKLLAGEAKKLTVYAEDIEHTIVWWVSKELKVIRKDAQILEHKAAEWISNELEDLKQRAHDAGHDAWEVEHKAARWVAEEAKIILKDVQGVEHRAVKKLAEEVETLEDDAKLAKDEIARIEHGIKNKVAGELKVVEEDVKYIERKTKRLVSEGVEDLRISKQWLSKKARAVGEGLYYVGEPIIKGARTIKRTIRHIEEDIEDARDKVLIRISDLLKSYREGLTIADIIKKLNLARHTVLARLHKLVGKGFVGIRKINMAKLHVWKKHEEVPEEKPEAQPVVEVTPLVEEHIKWIEKARPKERPLAEELERIKKEIKEELIKGQIEKPEAAVKEQREPIAHIVKEAKEIAKKKPETASVKTGIAGLDALLTEGIPRGSSVLVAGGAGSGKTVLGLQMAAYHASHGDKCLYMSFEESEENLIHHMEGFGWNPRELIKKGNLIIKRFNPFEITRSVDALLMKAKGELLIDVEPVILPSNFKPDFVVVDSLTAIASAFTGKEESYRIYIEQLFRFFEKLDATSFLVTETKQIPTVFSTTGVEEFLADGVIVLYNIKRGNIRENAVEVLKLRGVAHEKKIVAFEIADDGIVIYPEQEVFGNISGTET